MSWLKTKDVLNNPNFEIHGVKNDGSYVVFCYYNERTEERHELAFHKDKLRYWFLNQIDEVLKYEISDRINIIDINDSAKKHI